MMLACLILAQRLRHISGPTNMTNNPRTIRGFIASPGDLAVERRAFKEVIDELNTGFGDGAGVKFEALGWEDTLASTGRRSQSVINLEVDRADVFILAMHRRWGREAPDAQHYSSYTEEEFHRAFDRWKKDGDPEIFVFFKHIDAASMADPGPQLQQVLDFRRELEDSRQVLYRPFADEAGFKGEVDRHLRAYAKGELPKPDAPRDKILLPLPILEEVKQARAAAAQAERRAEQEHHQAEAALARVDELALELAQQAAQAALDGRVEQARQTFAKAHQGTTNLDVLYLAFDFYFRTGDLATSEEMLERRLALGNRDAETADTAGSLGNLGVIYGTRGELDRAEEMHQKALAIFEKLGDQVGMAIEYGNLGLIYRHRSDLDRAEEMYQKSLAIFEKLGHQEYMASEYGNLGVIYQMRGELRRAEELYRMALAIHAKLGRQEGMASDVAALGLVYYEHGEMDKAEEMHLKGLGIEERLGRQEGMARQYGNLGTVAMGRGDMKRARELLTKARDLYAKVGIPYEVKRTQEAIDGLPPE